MRPNEQPTVPNAVPDAASSTRLAHGAAAEEGTRTNSFRLEDTPAHVPAHISRFEIRRRLGSGGFGCVYLAYDPTLHREIALKVPRDPSRWAEDQTQTFLHEARIAAQLKHPSVIAIYDAGVCDTNGVFIAMEYVEGESLAERLKRGKLSVPEAVRVLGQIADAMHHGHKLGLVHRDLKPSNVLLDRSGNVKVCDFGLALHEDAQHSHRGEVSGTRAYMSPEQITGNCHLLDGRSDVWSLGVMLYECLSGRRPFRGDDWEQTREEILTRDPRPLRQVDDSIPEALDDLCRRCFRRDVADRLPTALDFRQALAGLGREKVAAKRRISPAVAGTVLLCAALAAGIGVYFSGKPQPGLREDNVSPPPVTPRSSPPDRTPRDLLAQAPRPVVFEAADPQSVFTYADASRRLTIGSLYWSAFTCGEHPREMRLNVSITHSAEPAIAGVFWGLHPEAVPGGVSQQTCLGVVVEPARDAALPATARFYRLGIANGISGSLTIASTHGIDKASVPIDWKAPVDLELHVNAGKLVGLTVQGTVLDLSAPATMEWEAYSKGDCGLLASQSVHHVVFTQAVLQPLTKE
jgi:serine/threonine protein kinase